MKKKRAVLQTFLFFLALVIPSILWGIFGILGVRADLDFDTGENRNMHTFSSDTSLSNLTSELEQTYNDHVPFRSVLLRMSRNLDSTLEKPYSDGIEPLVLGAYNRLHGSGSAKSEQILSAESSGSTEDPSGHIHDFREVEHRDADYENYGYTLYRCSCGEEKKDIYEKLVDDSYFPYKEAGPGVVQGRFDWLFLDETTEDYQCINLFEEEDLERLAQRFTLLRDLCAEQGKEVLFLFLPNKNTIYPEYMPTLERGDISRTQQLEDYMKANTDLNLEYVCEELLEAKPYHQLYHKVDTHWNSWGGLAAFNVLHKMLELPEVTPEQLNPESSPKDTGDLLVMSGVTEPVPGIDTSWNLHYKQDTEATVTTENGWEMRYTEAFSGADIQKNVVLIGDSFNHVLMEMLPCDYSHVTYINWEILDEVDPALITGADIIIVDEVERYLQIVERNVEYLINTLS